MVYRLSPRRDQVRNVTLARVVAVVRLARILGEARERQGARRLREVPLFWRERGDGAGRATVRRNNTRPIQWAQPLAIFERLDNDNIRSIRV